MRDERPVCAWCGRLFDQTNAKGPTPRYCRRSHRQRAYELRRLQRFHEDTEPDLSAWAARQPDKPKRDAREPGDYLDDPDGRLRGGGGW